MPPTRQTVINTYELVEITVPSVVVVVVDEIVEVFKGVVVNIVTFLVAFLISWLKKSSISKFSFIIINYCN